MKKKKLFAVLLFSQRVRIYLKLYGGTKTIKKKANGDFEVGVFELLSDFEK